MSRAERQAQPLQIPYLDSLCHSHAIVTLYLVNGIKLRGTLIGFDNHTVLISGGPIKQLVYKHAISTVVQEPAAHRG